MPTTVYPRPQATTRYNRMFDGMAMLSSKGSILDSNHPGLALDGIYSTCAVTGKSTAPWWMVVTKNPVNIGGLHLLGSFCKFPEC